MQITLTAVSRKEKTSKAGKPFTSVGIRCNEYGERWLSGFANKDNAGWKVGDTVEVDVETKGEYLNFSVPKASMSPLGNAGNAEIKNYLEFKIMPVLAQFHKELVIISERLNVALGSEKDDGFKMPDFSAADDKVGEDSPF